MLAGPGTGVAHATGGFYYTNAAGFGDLWWDPSTGVFWSSHSNKTPLNAIQCEGSVAHGVWCEYQLPNGKCMTDDATGGTVVADNCSQTDSQYWWTPALADGYEAFDNEYYDIYQGCAGNYSYLWSPKSGAEVTVSCGNTVSAQGQWSLSDA
jgi:hypothetical protein